METQKYKEMFENMLLDADFDFGFVSDFKHKFFIKAAGFRITWDHSANTIELPSLDEDGEVRMHAKLLSGMSPAQLVNILKGHTTKQEYYIPTSQEDEFQASTARIGNILPFELVEYLERLLSVALECIIRYSIDYRKYK